MTAHELPEKSPLHASDGNRVTLSAGYRVALLGASLLAAVAFSRYLGPDANWNLRNYHYYNGRAILTLSFLDDVAPAGIQTYLNPVVDIPIYLFTSMFGSAWGLMLWVAILQWVCWLAVWRFTTAFESLRSSLTLRVIAFVFALCGSGAASLAFTTLGDWVVAALLCEATTRIFAWRREPDAHRHLVHAGVWMGIALGVKLTSAVFVIAIVIATVVAFGIRAAVRLAQGGVIGLLVLAVPWMTILLFRFGSPVFPFYNTVFGAGSAPESNFDDARFGSHSIRDIVSFPFDVAEATSKFGELALAEWRYLALIALVALVVVLAPGRRIEAWTRSPIVRWWTIVLGLSYCAWIVVFGYYRYFLYVEIAVSLLIVVLATRLTSSVPKLAILMAIATIVGLSFQTIPDWGRGDVLHNPELAAIVGTRTNEPQRVVFVGSPPFGHMTHSFPATARFASMFAYSSNELVLDADLESDLNRFIERGLADDALYVVRDQGATPLPQPLDELQVSECSPFVSIDRPLEICQLRTS
jgi:hypothetical protein